MLREGIRGQTDWNHNHRKLIKLITWTTALSNLIKLWAMLCRATKNGRVMVKSSDKTWSTGEGNGKPLHYSCLENPMSSMKRQKDRTLKDELHRSVGAQYATGDQRRNNSRKNEEMFSSLQFSHSVVSDSLQPHEPQHARPPIHHQLPESTQTHVHWVGDAIQPSHPLSSLSPPAFNLSQHQGLFKWVSSLYQVA